MTASGELYLWQHQQRGVQWIKDCDWSAMLAMDMGTGKTATAIHAIRDHAMEAAVQSGVRRSNYLVLCPLAVIGVWRRELARWMPGAHVCGPEDVDECGSASEPVVAVTNYEQLSASRRGREAMMAVRWAGVVLDESHRVGNPATKASKYVCRLPLRGEKPLRLCLSGTPFASSPMNVFGQYLFLNDSVFGRSFTTFRSRYAVMRHIPGVPVPVIAGFRNLDDLQARYDLLAYRVRADDVLDLPPLTETVINVDMDAAPAILYKSLRDEMIAETKAGVITADNALVKLVRLQQLTSGIAVMESGDVHDVGDWKGDAVAELISEAGGEPVVVFARFTRELDRLCARYGERYAEISGHRKDGLGSDGKLAPGKQVYGVQIQSGSVGIDCTAARIAVFISKTLSLADLQQSIRRLVRPGQTRPVSVYHVVARDTIDEAIEKNLGDIGTTIARLVDGFRQQDSEV